jgi:hypothetical protein
MDKNLVSYKALRFTTESNRSSMLYEVKRARAIFDPSLAVPGTSRRGGFRCPVGTRYGGQITDRFGRNCGWGVARRLANEISDLGERLENVGDRRRERKLRKRNDRMAGRLAGAPGAIERAAGRVGDALDLTGRQGGQRNRVGAEVPRPTGRLERAAGRLAEVVDPDKPNREGRARRADAPQAPRGRDRGRDLTPDNAADTPARPAREEREDVNLLAAEPTEVLEEMREELENATDGRDSDDYKRVMAELKRRKATRGRRQNNANPRPRPAAAKRPRRNLRASEERRMQREIDNPGAARTDVDAAPAPAARPRPAAPRRPANAGRRRPANNRDTASRQNEGAAARKPSAAPAARETTPARTITRDDNAGRLGGVERDAKRINRQMQENPEDNFFAGEFNEEQRNVFNNLDQVQDADLLELEKLVQNQRDNIQREDLDRTRVGMILADVRRERQLRSLPDPRKPARAGQSDNATNRGRLFTSGGGVRAGDLNQVLNDDNFKEYVLRDILPNDPIMILNDDRNFPDSAARKRSKADEARQKVTISKARWDRLEDAINRGQIADRDFFERDDGERISIGQVRRGLKDYRDAWQEVYDRNNGQPARAENTVEQARRQVEAARNPRSVPADLRMGFDIPDDGLDKAQLRRMLGNNMDDDYARRVQEGIIQNRDVQLPQNMAAWRRGDLVELRANVQVQENALDDARRELREAADAFGNAGDEDKEDAARNVIDKNGQVQRVMDTRNAFKRRAAELEGNDAPNAPEPSRTPSAPREPSAAAQQATRIGGDDDVRGRTPAQWRAFFEAQGAPNVNERVSRANNAVNDGVGRADADFNGAFNGGGDALMRMRDRDGILPAYERRLAELDEVVASKKRNYDAREGQGVNDNFLVAQRDLIVAIAHRDRYKERKAEIDAALAAPAPEPLNPELARQAEQRVKDAIEGRQRTLALHLDRQYGAGNAPWKEMTLQKRQELLRDAQGRGPEASAARNQLEAWAKAMYSHPEIQGSNGKTYRSVATASLSGNQITVSVNFEVKNANGTWTNMGDSSRYLDLNAGVVRNGTMFIRGNDHKNNGIQTVYNQHAFMYAKAAGFEKITVGTADDGPYVWGRIGFEAPIPNTHVSNLNTQLNAFRRGDTSIIKNEEDANIIEYLIDKHKDNPNSVRHMDFIYALTNPYGNDEREAKRARDTELRNWFATNMGLASGTFYLDKNLIKADPRDEE